MGYSQGSYWDKSEGKMMPFDFEYMAQTDKAKAYCIEATAITL